MKLLFLDHHQSSLADTSLEVLQKVKEKLLLIDSVQETFDATEADAIIIQEKFSYKNFRFINELMADVIVSKYLHKVFTINCDDCATGLLRGLYTSLPTSRFNKLLHVSVPFSYFPNELVLQHNQNSVEPKYLATWRGNTKSNKLRPKMISTLNSFKYKLENTDSWLNHDKDEKQQYVDLLLDGKFSLCPGGWAPVSFRIYESMALGRTPVIIADDFKEPAGPDWSKFAFFYPENKINELDKFLTTNASKYEDMGKAAYHAWKQYFSPDVLMDYYASSLLSLIKTTPATNNERELKRFKSFNVYWSNKWTVYQRMVIGVKKIAASSG
ncbi:MAG: exostosin family protein [Ferruginibacter sp.]